MASMPPDASNATLQSPDGRFTLVRTIRKPLCYGCGTRQYPEFLCRGSITLTVYDQAHHLRARLNGVMYWPDDSFYFNFSLPTGEKFADYGGSSIAFTPDSRYVIVGGTRLAF
jgi:hypothetical protein